MIRLYRIPFSANVERVALALAHKGLEAESVWIDAADRGPVRKVSGQDLVPVLEIDGEVLVESMDIVRELEARFPERPLYPRDPARRAELLLFVDWFNRVWKVPPSLIGAELGRPEPHRARIEALGREMADALDLFEDLLAGRQFLFGDAFSAADCCAFPFLKYAALPLPEGDEKLFHEILRDYQPLSSHIRLAGWIRRVDERPRV